MLMGVALVGCRFGDQMPTPGIPTGTKVVVGGRSFTLHEPAMRLLGERWTLWGLPDEIFP